MAGLKVWVGQLVGGLYQYMSIICRSVKWLAEYLEEWVDDRMAEVDV